MQLLIKVENGHPFGRPLMADNIRHILTDLPRRYLLASDLVGTGFAPFVRTSRPDAPDPTKLVRETLPIETNSDGEWMQAWEIVERDDLSEAEREAMLAAHDARLQGARRGTILQERARRLALGFDYDFGDDRGIHRINTTPEDMAGWDEVSKAAQTALNIGQADFEISIKTGTGMATVTAAEWQLMQLAAAQYRQPIYQAAFALRAMNPIPADYTDDKWWP